MTKYNATKARTYFEFVEGLGDYDLLIRASGRIARKFVNKRCEFLIRSQSLKKGMRDKCNVKGSTVLVQGVIAGINQGTLMLCIAIKKARVDGVLCLEGKKKRLFVKLLDIVSGARGIRWEDGQIMPRSRWVAAELLPAITNVPKKEQDLGVGGN